MSTSHQWTADELAYLRAHYPTTRTADLVQALGIVRGVNAGAIARSVPAQNVERAIRDARLAALRRWRRDAGR